jgi:hypothetical protein
MSELRKVSGSSVLDIATSFHTTLFRTKYVPSDVIDNKEKT